MPGLKFHLHPTPGDNLGARVESAPAHEPALRALHREIASCTTCPSMKPWRQFGPDAYGDPSSRFLLVGEAPGYVSWRKRQRFTGPAGMLIRRALRRLDHPCYRDLEDLLYMTDAVKCHPAPAANPASNRSPTRAEARACSGYLVRELRLLRPSVIITFGKTAAEQVSCAVSESGEAGCRPEIIAFPHPSPRNRVTIFKQYPSMQALEDAIAATFHRLVTRLEA